MKIIIDKFEKGYVCPINNQALRLLMSKAPSEWHDKVKQVRIHNAHSGTIARLASGELHIYPSYRAKSIIIEEILIQMAAKAAGRLRGFGKLSSDEHKKFGTQVAPIVAQLHTEAPFLRIKQRIHPIKKSIVEQTGDGVE